jgi:molecular chaperone DnaK (HSP70)
MTGPAASPFYQILLVGGSTYIPKVRQVIQEYLGKEPFQSMSNPDEAVVHGAAFQGGILSGDMENGWCGCVDLSLLSLGIETTGGMFSRMIQRNSILPSRKSHKYVPSYLPQALTLKLMMND